MSTKASHRVIYLRRIILGLLIFAVVLCGFTSTLYRCLRTSWFYSTNGRVISTKLDSRINGRVRQFKPIVEYSYTVDGTDYESDSLSLFNRYDSESVANFVIQQYQPGDTCTVYFDPVNPQITLLSKKWPIWMPLVFICEIVFVIVYFTCITIAFVRSRDAARLSEA